MSVAAGSPAALGNPPQVHQYKYFDKLVSAFVAVLLVSNLVAPKMIAFGPFLFSGAQLLFPVTYIFGDVFTEVYGYADSRKAHLERLLRSGAARAAERHRDCPAAGARVARSGGIRDRARDGAAGVCRQPYRLLGGRVRELLRDGRR